MSKKFYATQYGFKPSAGEKNDQPSMTIPNESMTVIEMIKRSERGLPIGGRRQPMYTGDDEIPDFSRMDIIQLHEYREYTETIVNDYNSAVKAKEAEIAQKKIDDIVEKRAQKLLKEQKSQESLNPDQHGKPE